MMQRCLEKFYIKIKLKLTHCQNRITNLSTSKKKNKKMNYQLYHKKKKKNVYNF